MSINCFIPKDYGPILDAMETEKAIKLIKESVRRSMTNSLEQQLAWEGYAQYTCTTTEDFQEGVRSFLEKRPPLFKGK